MIQAEHVTEEMLTVGNNGETITVIGARTHRGSKDDPNLIQQAVHDVILANMIAKRSDEVGRRIKGKTLLQKYELVHGVPRLEPEFETKEEAESYKVEQTRRELLQKNRHDRERKVVSTLSHEERLNAALIAREEQQAFDAKPQIERMRIESDRRLAAKKIEATLAELRNGEGYQEAEKKLDDLEFITKFDAAIDGLLRTELQHQRSMLRDRLDVATVMKNAATIATAIVQRNPLESISLAVSENIAEKLSQNAPGPWDKPHLKFYQDGITYYRLHYAGQSVTISEGLFTGKSDSELLTSYFGVRK